MSAVNFEPGSTFARNNLLNHTETDPENERLALAYMNKWAPDLVGHGTRSGPVTAYPPDQEQQAAFRELDGLRRIRDLARKGCGCDGACQSDDAITTPLDAKDYE